MSIFSGGGGGPSPRRQAPPPRPADIGPLEASIKERNRRAAGRSTFLSRGLLGLEPAVNTPQLASVLG